jgi:hypothetical protein
MKRSKAKEAECGGKSASEKPYPSFNREIKSHVIASWSVIYLCSKTIKENSCFYLAISMSKKGQYIKFLMYEVDSLILNLHKG